LYQTGGLSKCKKPVSSPLTIKNGIKVMTKYVKMNVPHQYDGFLSIKKITAESIHTLKV
tara:strand:+ start:340 stop:516 length:177 start_codon:yes stop_codon:yes gene_type:complete